MTPALLGIAVVLALTAAVAWRYIVLRRKPEGGRLYPEALTHVEVSADGIRCTDQAGILNSVAWPDLGRVFVATNDSGPWGTDIWWLLEDRSGTLRVAVPGGATGEGELLAALQRLPGFNDDAVVRAMGSTSNARFEVWVAGEGSSSVRALDV